ncbi:MAG: hypothetical protein ACPHL6_13380, partial [Rubripirellula sp.]
VNQACNVGGSGAFTSTGAISVTMADAIGNNYTYAWSYTDPNGAFTDAEVTGDILLFPKTDRNKQKGKHDSVSHGNSTFP